jgi:hypothetical protein
MNPEPPETITHPVFGELRWESERAVWFTQIRDATNEWIDVSIEPEEGDRLARLDRAAELYSRAMRAERQLLRTAVRSELPELYNDTWRQANEPELTAAELVSRLVFTFIQVSPTAECAVILSCDARELFGGYSVDVELDSEVRYLDVNLIG